MSYVKSLSQEFLGQRGLPFLQTVFSGRTEPKNKKITREEKLTYFSKMAVNGLSAGYFNKL